MAAVRIGHALLNPAPSFSLYYYLIHKNHVLSLNFTCFLQVNPHSLPRLKQASAQQSQQSFDAERSMGASQPSFDPDLEQHGASCASQQSSFDPERSGMASSQPCIDPLTLPLLRSRRRRSRGSRSKQSDRWLRRSPPSIRLEGGLRTGMGSGLEEGSYLRLIYFSIAQL